jgi:Peptidase family M23
LSNKSVFVLPLAVLIFAVCLWGQNGNVTLQFPIAGLHPHTAPIVSIFDHSLKADEATAFTGEAGQATAGSVSGNCYRNPNGSDFVLYDNYAGLRTGGTAFLCYDGHAGFDIRVPRGQQVLASADGIIERADDKFQDGQGTSFGNVIFINHGSGIKTIYGHLQHASLKVSKGSVVNKGQIIASVDSTGNSTADHLHFEVRINAVSADPYGWKGWLLARSVSEYSEFAGFDHKALWFGPKQATTCELKDNFSDTLLVILIREHRAQTSGSASLRPHR